MDGRTLRASLCVLALGCLAIAGCGGRGSASRADHDQVRRWLPAARDIRCVRGPSSVTECHALVVNAQRSVEDWACEFSFESDRGRRAYSGASSCWSRNGTRASLRSPAD